MHLYFGERVLPSLRTPRFISEVDGITPHDPDRLPRGIGLIGAFAVAFSIAPGGVI